MQKHTLAKLTFIASLMFYPLAPFAAENCQDSGPQTPRDISSPHGDNPEKFPYAPAASEMNLCNIHLHKNSEHKGPGFSIFLGRGEYEGFACNETSSLTEEELKDPTNGKGYFKNIKPGDTIEVHWVHSSCDIEPGPGLSSCLTTECENPKLRVEAQVFLLVNDKTALDFTDYAYAGTITNGKYQAKSLPTGSGTPILFKGSTTGPKYTDDICSPAQVTWSVRPECAKLDISSLHEWAKQGNVFEETSAHGIRELVVDPNLLSKIKK